MKPAKAGVKVRKEDGTHLAEKGEKVKRTAFWVRRIKDGDVIDVEAAKQAAAKTKQAKSVSTKGE